MAEFIVRRVYNPTADLRRRFGGTFQNGISPSVAGPEWLFKRMEEDIVRLTASLGSSVVPE
jgi:hypothetical protein